ncbi:hypothetical protein Nepgr_006766 [Nepenthes gracilis]|uniref:Uncharacterized protein n=1 Tax=Nepenthes gracilis TaxID=150966 RepID=A0AAD3S657_NEPGR|nr:hypothetical protein Nepgr_006766 [Nepenthes gracilis]
MKAINLGHQRWNSISQQQNVIWEQSIGISTANQHCCSKGSKASARHQPDQPHHYHRHSNTVGRPNQPTTKLAIGEAAFNSSHLLEDTAADCIFASAPQYQRSALQQ